MSDKILSIHGKCTKPCVNSDVCYNLDRPEIKRFGELNEIAVSKKECNNFKIFHSICDEKILKKVLKLRNKNITYTINFNLFKQYSFRIQKLLVDPQISVNNLNEISEVGDDIQKLFLIRDDKSFEFALWVLKHSAIRNIHFPIYQDFITKQKCLLLLKYYSSCKDNTITIDSCLENYAVHKKCVYEDNYIDINYDMTVRKCPFDKIGLLIYNINELDTLIDNKCHNDCIYSKLFNNN